MVSYDIKKKIRMYTNGKKCVYPYISYGKAIEINYSTCNHFNQLSFKRLKILFLFYVKIIPSSTLLFLLLTCDGILLHNIPTHKGF